MANSNNKTCVRVDTTHTGLHFMKVHNPAHVRVFINADGNMTVNVNDSCVFIVSNPANMRVENMMARINHIPGD